MSDIKGPAVSAAREDRPAVRREQKGLRTVGCHIANVHRHVQSAHHNGITCGISEAEQAFPLAERDRDREAAGKLVYRQCDIAACLCERGGVAVKRKRRRLGKVRRSASFRIP